MINILDDKIPESVNNELESIVVDELTIKQRNFKRIGWFLENDIDKYPNEMPHSKYTLDENGVIIFQSSIDDRTWKYHGKILNEDEIELDIDFKATNHNWKALFTKLHKSAIDNIESPLAMINADLKHFDGDVCEMYAYITDPDSQEIRLEKGDFIYYESDDMSDDEIVYWATDQGSLIDGEEDFRSEDGSVDMEALRKYKRELEEIYASSNSYPSGRAFNFFESSGFDYPDDIEMKFVDGPFPGNDWQGIYVYGLKSLKKLQTFLQENGEEVNFTLKIDY